MIHKAISLGGAGDVIVVDGAGDTSNALVGELMMMDAQARGIEGFVIDGAVRDLDVFAQGQFGCFARAVSPEGRTRMARARSMCRCRWAARW